jgi:hypothetical protein
MGIFQGFSGSNLLLAHCTVPVVEEEGMNPFEQPRHMGVQESLHNAGRLSASDYIGKLGVVAHFQDFDAKDAIEVGILEQRAENGYFYLQGSARGWRHCRPVGCLELA